MCGGASSRNIQAEMPVDEATVNICHRHQLFTAQDLIDTGKQGLLFIGLEETIIDDMSEWIHRETGLWIED
jgi:hypothetical protein